MITAHEAEELATQKVQEYVNACGCDSIEDVGKVFVTIVIKPFSLAFHTSSASSTLPASSFIKPRNASESQ